MASPFSFKRAGTTYYGNQMMKSALPTTFNKHKISSHRSYYYPIRNTFFSCKIIDIEGDEAHVHVMYNGNEKMNNHLVKTYSLTELMLVKEYSSLNGENKTEHSSEIQKLVPTLQQLEKTKGKMTSAHQPTIPAIVIGSPAVVMAKLIELSNNTVTLAITHEGLPGITFRTFDSMSDICSVFKTQGSMDRVGQGRSCGVEAVYNAGFLDVKGSDFNSLAAKGVDASEFVAHVMAVSDDSATDNFMNNTGDGNNIPPNQMYATLERLSSFKLDQSLYSNLDELSDPAFWDVHQWALIFLKICGGHWVSLECMIYKGEKVLCLREGRGNTAYDYITAPANGQPKRLHELETRQPVCTGVKRKNYN